MRFLADEITERLFNHFDKDIGPLPFADVLLEYAKRVAPECQDTEIADDVLEPKQKDRYMSALLGKQKQAIQEGRFCPYDFAPDGSIIGYCFPRRRDSALMAMRRRVAPYIPPALAVLRRLNPDQFEKFGRRLLHLLKAEEAHVTSHSRDEGVDFFGWLSIPETLIMAADLPTFRSEFRVFVIGQAKRYDQSTPIGPEYVRELVGATALFRHDQLSPWQSRYQVPSIRLMSPILPLIITTGKVSTEAKNLAQKSGVVTKDGAQLVEFLCLEGVGLSDNGAGVVSFSETDFLAWLDDEH